MRRLFSVLLATLVCSLVLVPAARADDPIHTKTSFDFDFTHPAGTFCDFELHDLAHIIDNTIIFGDPNEPNRVITQETAYVTHINVDTGYTLTEVDHLVFQFDAADARLKVVGLNWHLRTPDGKLVVVQAGQAVFDTNTGELLKITPALNPDGAAVICPALGGHPAN